MSRVPRLLVIGAGPVGVVAALAAAQAGFDVQVVEADATIATNPRAATTHPSTLEMINRVGLLDRFVAEGLVAREFQFWDRETRKRIATFDHQILRNDTPFPFVVQTEQHKLVRMALDALERLGASVRFNTKVVACTQGSDSVSVQVESETGVETLSADWLIAADGGRSTIRKQIGVEFEGFTWPERFLVLTVLDDIQALMGCCFRNYLAGTDEWANLFKVSGDDGLGRWRAVFPTRPDETDEEALSDDSASKRLNGIHPLERPYQLVHRNLYRVHQRVAATFRVGRVLLAGDAAHVNNPIGGLGLNFGIHDAIDAVDSLSLVALEGRGDGALDAYALRRRTLNLKFVQEQTVANKKRLEEKDPTTRQSNLDNLSAMSLDPERARAFLLRSSLIQSVREAAAVA
ncbi:NAD(P)/FAD-dependent oxidoreductase [Beijerinckia sp. L45]|uniref:FAD-dependent oxidoreductase n=1 Tax=Beijerinckia sp. L45 TaxID=1641855 RepID=UPI00131EC29E|nr:FAD-dependent monooxygenase [Beijerinckia sp. L45]